MMHMTDVLERLLQRGEWPVEEQMTRQACEILAHMVNDHEHARIALTDEDDPAKALESCVRACPGFGMVLAPLLRAISLERECEALRDEVVRLKLDYEPIDLTNVLASPAEGL